MGPVFSDYVQNDQYTTIDFAQYVIKCKHVLTSLTIIRYCTAPPNSTTRTSTRTRKLTMAITTVLFSALSYLKLNVI